jgi:outer membrane protein
MTTRRIGTDLFCARRGRFGLAGAAVLGVLVSLGPGAGAPAAAQTLGEALANAYATNPTLRAARARLRGVNEGVPQALSNWRPRVTLSGSVGQQYTDQDSNTTNISGGSTPTSGTLSVVQPLFRGGRTLAGTRAAENDVRAQRSNLLSVEQGVLLSGVRAYMDVWRDQAVVELNANNERVIRRQLEATQDRFAVGEVTRTDVAQAETRLASATAQRIQSEGSLASNKAIFQEVIGLESRDLSAPRLSAELPGQLDEVIALATARNPDVQAAAFAEKAALNRVREVTGELLPDVQLRATASRSDDTTRRDTTTEQAAVLAELTIPLYQQGAVTSRVRQAKQVSSQRRVEIEERRRQAEQEAISAWESLLTAKAQIVSFEAGVRSAEIALEGVTQENLVGARTILDILDAEQELLDARVSLVRSQRDEVVASFQTMAAIGRLTALDLGLAVTVYDPETDYREVRDSWFGLSAPGAE